MLDKFKHKLGVGRNDFLFRYRMNAKEFDIKDNKTLNINDLRTLSLINEEEKEEKEMKIEKEGEGNQKNIFDIDDDDDIEEHQN